MNTMRIMKLDSVIFHTQRLAVIREFYAEKLGLAIGTYMKDGTSVPDESESYVNFDCGGTLLCFEQGAATDTGTLVLLTDSLSRAKSTLQSFDIPVAGPGDSWLRLQDPDNRNIILQEKSQITGG